MRFSDIEQRRQAAGIDQSALCAKAGIHVQTYSRLKRRPGAFGASERTLARLAAALDELAPEGRAE